MLKNQYFFEDDSSGSEISVSPQFVLGRNYRCLQLEEWDACPHAPKAYTESEASSRNASKANQSNMRCEFNIWGFPFLGRGFHGIFSESL